VRCRGTGYVHCEVGAGRDGFTRVIAEFGRPNSSLQINPRHSLIKHTLCPRNVPIQSPVMPFRSIGLPSAISVVQHIRDITFARANQVELIILNDWRELEMRNRSRMARTSNTSACPAHKSYVYTLAPAL
jgi:hypothetical protein